MAKERVTIPDEIAVQVLFNSDRTCCVCRASKQVQIHHIDDDPANNDPENLAVLCLLCHDDTQIRGGFARKLNAGLVRMYRNSWNASVKLKLNPQGDSDRRILIAEALQEVIGVSHQWRNIFRWLVAPDDRVWDAPDFWARVIELVPQKYTPDVYENLRELFDIGIAGVTKVIDRIHSQCGDVLPADLRTLFLRSRRGLESESSRYRTFDKDAPIQQGPDRYFSQLCEGVLSSLRDLATACIQRQQDVLGDDLSLYEGPEEDYDPYDRSE